MVSTKDDLSREDLAVITFGINTYIRQSMEIFLYSKETAKRGKEVGSFIGDIETFNHAASVKNHKHGTNFSRFTEKSNLC